MAETRDWRGNGRAFGWLLALVVLAAVIWGLVELLSESADDAAMEPERAVPAAEEVRKEAPPAPPPPLRIA